MPDNPYDALFSPANPRDRVHGIASKIGISPDIADDYLKVTKVESGHNINVGSSAKGAQGFGQVMPDRPGLSVRTISGRRYNLQNPDENVEAGLRLFSAGGNDPVGRRLEYFGGAGARQRYERTGRIPNISDGNLTAQQYVQATGGQQTPKPTPNPYDALFSSAAPQTPPESSASPVASTVSGVDTSVSSEATPRKIRQSSAQSLMQSMVLPPRQTNEGPDFQPTFGGGQTYREWNPRAAEAHEKPGGMVMGDFRRREERDTRIAREIRPQVVKDFFNTGAGVRQELPPEVQEQQIAADPRLRQYIESETQRRATELEQREQQVYRVERGFAPPLGLADKVRDLRKNPEQLVPFLSSIPEINNLLAVGRSTDKLEKGEDLTTEEQVQLREFIAASKQNKTMMYQVADVIAALPAFAGEFALTGGIYSAGRKTAIKGLEKLITKEGLALAEKKLATRLAVKVGTGLVGAAAQTIPASATRIPAGVLYREAGGDSFGKALRDTLTDQFIEIASERAGGLLEEIPLPKKLSAIRDAVTERWLNKVPGRTVEQLQKIVEKSGWHGPLGEILEERVGDVAKYATGLQPSPLPSLQQLAVEGLAFSVPTVGMAATERLANRNAKTPKPLETAPDVIERAEEAPITQPEDGKRPLVAEAPEAIHAQMDALVNGRGNRYGVLIPKGQSAPTRIPKGFITTRTSEGVVIHPKELSAEDIHELVNDGNSWRLLGHQNPEGPEATRVVVARAGVEGQGGIKPGTELLSSFVVPGQEQNAIEEMRAQFAPYEPTFEVGGQETAAKAVEDRTPPTIREENGKFFVTERTASGKIERGFKTRESAEQHLAELSAKAPAEEQAAYQKQYDELFYPTPHHSIRQKRRRRGEGKGQFVPGFREQQVEAPKEIPEKPQESQQTITETITKTDEGKPGTKHPKTGRKFSSTQVNLPPEASKLQKKAAAEIPESELAADGRETKPHITVKYGLHTENSDDVSKILATEPPIRATIGKVSIFRAKDGAEYDVVKMDVDSPDLHRLNAKIAAETEVTDTHPEYKPHVTLAYVKPGEGAKYIGKSNPLSGTEITLNSVLFSGRGGQEVEIPLTGKSQDIISDAEISTSEESGWRSQMADREAAQLDNSKKFLNSRRVQRLLGEIENGEATEKTVRQLQKLGRSYGLEEDVINEHLRLAEGKASESTAERDRKVSDTAREAAGDEGRPLKSTSSELSAAVSFTGQPHTTAQYLKDSPLKAEVLAALPAKTALHGPNLEAPEMQTGPIKLRAENGDIWEVDLAYDHKGDASWKTIGSRMDGFAVRNTGQQQIVDEEGTLHSASGERLFSRAFHGSPYSFDKFSTEKIGTGEGAQSYGHGLYFTDKKEIAEHYRSQLTGRGASPTDIATRIYDSLPDKFSDTEKRALTVKELRQRIADSVSASDDLGHFEDRKAFESKMNAAIEAVEKNSFRGHTYEVELAPKEDEYLLWDKPLNEQSETVKKALTKAFQEIELPEGGKPYADRNPDGQSIYATISSSRGFSRNFGKGDTQWSAHVPSEKAGSEYLHSLGIRGVKYLDQGSRAEGEGSHNYVLFSDDDVSITAQFSLGIPRSAWATIRKWLGIGQHTVKREGNIIVLGDEAATALIVGDEEMPIHWQGEFNTAAEARARLARTAEGKRIRPNPTSQPRMVADLEKVRGEIKAALDEGHASVVIASPHAVRHERFHEASYRLGAESPLTQRHKDLKVLTDTPEYQTAARALLAMYYQNDAHILLEEIAARIADGKHNELGLTREQAIDWMSKWFTSFADTHGATTISQFQELAKDAQKALAAAIDAQTAKGESAGVDEDVQRMEEGRESRAGPIGHESDNEPPLFQLGAPEHRAKDSLEQEQKKRAKSALDRLQDLARQRGQQIREAPAAAPVTTPKAATPATPSARTSIPPPTRRAAGPTPEGQTAERSFPKTAESVGYRGGTDRDYTVLTNAASLESAQRRLTRLGAGGAAAELAQSDNPGAEDNALGILLMQQFERTGQIGRAVAVANDLSRKLTQAGQFVQAASIITRLSPEGVLLHAQKILKGKPLAEETAQTIIGQAKAVTDAERLVAEIQRQRPDIFGPNGEILPRSRESRTTAPRSTRTKIGTLQDRLATLEQQARERMQARAATAKTETTTLPTRGQRGAGISPVSVAADLGDLVIIGAAKLARSGITKAVWLAEMAKEASALTKKDLRKLYRESFEMYERERKQFLQESRVRGARRQMGTTTASAADVQRVINERLDAMTAARKARAELSRTFRDLNAGRTVKILRGVRDVWGLTRALITSVDISAGGRQGKMGLVTHPRAWLRGFARQFRGMSKKQYERMVSELQADPDYKYAVRFRLELTSVARAETSSLTAHEEVYQTELADKISWLRISQQAYDTMLDTLRMGWFKAQLAKMRLAGIDLEDPNNKEMLVHDTGLINKFTGRGGDARLRRIAPTANAFAFSVRFWASRLEALALPLNPRMYGMGEKAYSATARADAWKTVFGFYGLIALQIALAKLAGAEVNFDPDDPDFIFNPDSADFLKVKFGPHHVDFSAGLQSHLRVAARLAKSFYLREFQKEKPRTGPAEIVGKYLRSKEEPNVALIHDLFFSDKKDTESGPRGTNYAGEPVYLLGKPGTGKAERLGTSAIAQRILPIVIQDALAGWKVNSGPGSTALALTASVLGEGVTTYSKGYSEKKEKWPMQPELDRLQITINAPQRVKPGKNEKFKAETEEEYDARRCQEAEAIKVALQRLSEMNFFKSLPDRSKEAAIRATITAARESVRYSTPAKQRQQQANATP